MKRLLAILKGIYIRNQYNAILINFQILLDSMKHLNSIEESTFFKEHMIPNHILPEYKEKSTKLLSSITTMKQDFYDLIKLYKCNHKYKHKYKHKL